jgi:hypothetical protein
VSVGRSGPRFPGHGKVAGKRTNSTERSASRRKDCSGSLEDIFGIKTVALHPFPSGSQPGQPVVIHDRTVQRRRKRCVITTGSPDRSRQQGTTRVASPKKIVHLVTINNPQPRIKGNDRYCTGESVGIIDSQPGNCPPYPQRIRSQCRVCKRDTAAGPVLY